MTHTHTFEIPGELPSLNEYTGSNRQNRYAGGRSKKIATETCCYAVMGAMNLGLDVKPPFNLHITWVTKNNKKDPDNVAFAVKFILDGMMAAGLIENDGRKQVHDIEHHFETDKQNPRVIVELEEDHE